MNKMDLRAELENRISKREKKSNVPKWFFFCVLPICTAGMLIFLNSDLAVLKDQRHKKQPDALNQLLNESKNEVVSTRSSRPAAAKPKEVTNQVIELWQPESKENERKKQTVFNDQNYQPQGSINSIKPPPSRYYESGQARSNAQVKEVYRSFSEPVTKRTIHWQWKNFKSQRSGTFTYTERNGKIDTNGICTNYKYGSFVYRDCRKAAKKYFKDACSNYFRAACAAGEMIP